jgi:nicotinate-nucleotide adenylyltransferase
MAQRVILLFGGTFDPIHLGHAKVAGAAVKTLNAEKVVFIPAKCSPLKGFSPKAGDRARLEMITLAIAEDPVLAVSDCELQRPAPSYTLDTVRQFKQACGPDVSVHWLLGADGLDDLVHWHGIRELIDQCCLTTMYRAGYEPPDFARFEGIWGPKRVEKLQEHVVETPLVDVSSTKVRKRLAAGDDVNGMLHPDVIEYIDRHQLYRRESTD